MSDPSPLESGLKNRLLGLVDISERDLDRLVEELVFLWGETVEEFVRRRHRELQRDGVPAARAYQLIAEELPSRLFRCEGRSERQIRRILYG